MKPALVTMFLVMMGTPFAESNAQTVSSTNDATSIYAASTFSLPAQLTAEENYVIQIYEDGKPEPRTLSLPKGVTTITLSANALPRGLWRWQYYRRPMPTTELTVVQPSGADVRINPAFLYGTDAKTETLIRWEGVAGLKAYVVKVQAPEPPGATPVTWGKAKSAEVDAVLQYEESGQSKFNWYQLGIQAGESYRVSIEGLDANKEVIAKGAPQIISVESPWYSNLRKAGIKLQRADTLAPKDKAVQAATFGFTSVDANRNSTDKADPSFRAYQTEFAVLWSGTNLAGIGKPEVIPKVSVEARLNSSGPNKSNDALKVRLGFTRYTYNGLAGATAVNAKYETDGKTSIKKGVLELNFAPYFGVFGEFLPLVGAERKDVLGNVIPELRPPVRFLLTPVLGVEAGRTLSAATSNEVRTSVIRYVAGLRVDSTLDFVARAMGIPQVVAFADNTHRWLPKEESLKRANYLAAGLDFVLLPSLSLSGRYSVGKDAPKFEWVRSVQIGLGISF